MRFGRSSHPCRTWIKRSMSAFSRCAYVIRHCCMRLTWCSTDWSGGSLGINVGWCFTWSYELLASNSLGICVPSMSSAFSSSFKESMLTTSSSCARASGGSTGCCSGALRSFSSSLSSCFGVSDAKSLSMGSTRLLLDNFKWTLCGGSVSNRDK